MWVGIGAGFSLIGFEMTGGAVGCSVAALTLLGRPLGRTSLMALVDVGGRRGAVGSDGGADESSSAMGASMEAILAAKASSTRLASSVDRRFLAFRMAIARSCRSSFDSVSIS